jgi:hypothetical protein
VLHQKAAKRIFIVRKRPSVMEPCRCALCGIDASGEGLTAFVHSSDCPRCGTFDVTAGARVAWNSLDPAKKEVALPRLRAAMRGQHVALGREDIIRAAGVK